MVPVPVLLKWIGLAYKIRIGHLTLWYCLRSNLSAKWIKQSTCKKCQQPIINT